ncbi:unnamed protein product [Moneuplotes crassus]|uniref:Uncharacterized protein n=1 Tax=Euplotes crassus TaxID=5936 RepID=A0AAD1U7I6_EUPCR|nr:unnamed protein product [Moneuplotes crassus]
MRMMGNKESEIYRYKLGLPKTRKLDNSRNALNDTVSLTKLSNDVTQNNDDSFTYSRKMTLGKSESPNDEYLPRLGGARSRATSFKQPRISSPSRKETEVTSKRHQAYSIIKLKNMQNSPKFGRKLFQARVEGYLRQPLTNFDHMDDEIINSGIFDLKSSKASQIMTIPYGRFNDLRGTRTLRTVSEGKAQSKISRKSDLDIKKYCISELNRQNQLKERINFENRLKLQKDLSERIRKIKIETQNQKRQKAAENVKRINEQIDKKLIKGYKDKMKEILKQNKKQPDSGEKWIKEQLQLKAKERKLKQKEEQEIQECLGKLQKLESRQKKAEMRYKSNLANKTYGGREEYYRNYQKKMEIAKKEEEQKKLALQNYIARENKHKECFKDLQRRKKYEKQKKLEKEQAKIKAVERNLEIKIQERTRSVNRVKQKLLKGSHSVILDRCPTQLHKIQQGLKTESVQINKQRARRQLEYKKYKVILKHVNGLKTTLKKKLDQDLEIQQKSYDNYQENLKLIKQQEKLDKIVRKAQVNSRSMKKLIDKADVKDQVVVKKHLHDDEGESEEY